jgi:hypothetical protein
MLVYQRVIPELVIKPTLGFSEMILQNPQAADGKCGHTASLHFRIPTHASWAQLLDISNDIFSVIYSIPKRSFGVLSR